MDGGGARSWDSLLRHRVIGCWMMRASLFGSGWRWTGAECRDCAEGMWVIRVAVWGGQVARRAGCCGMLSILLSLLTVLLLLTLCEIG